MNIKQKIVTGISTGFILGDLGTWAATGFKFLTKTKVPLKVVDPLFGTTSIEWQNKFIYGLDLAGPCAAIVLLIGIALIYFLRTKKNR